MSGSDPFERALWSLHAAALDDARWPATSGLIDEACGVKGSGLVFGEDVPRDGVDLLFARFCIHGQRNEELERLYFGTYHAVDERLPRLRQLPDSELVHISSLYTDAEKKSSPVYNEVLALGESCDGLNVRLDGPNGSRIVWSISDPVNAEGWSSARVGTVRRFLPHLRQFVRVRQALAGAKALGTSMVGLLDHVGTGVIQLDRRGRVAAANDRARAVLRAGGGLTDRGGELRAALPEEDAVLQGLLARALPSGGGPGAGGSMTVRRGDSAWRLVLHVSPVREGGPEPREVEPGALVLVVEPAAGTGVDRERVGELLGLTPRESHLAVALAEGRTVQDVARETGRSVNTVRWHLQHIYAKLGLSRQAELVRAVMVLDEAPGVRR